MNTLGAAELGSFATLSLWICTLVIIGYLFVEFWEKAAELGIILFMIMSPFSMHQLVVHGAWDALVLGAMGGSCFLGDRFFRLPLHSFWHLFGGASLWLTLCLAIQ
jgi:hypothetical protein